jgi:hypothetical protein
MKKVIMIILVLVIIIIVIIGVLKISGFHFAKKGYGVPSSDLKFSKEKGVFMEELYPLQNKLPDDTINIINVWAERPWSYVDYFQTIKMNENDVMVIIKCDKSVYNEDNNFRNERVSKAYTDYTGEIKYVTFINKGIAIYLTDSIYSKLDTIEIKFETSDEKLRFVKNKPKTH